MEMSIANHLGRDLLLTTLLLVGPAVAVSLIVGLLVSIMQTVTSIQEQTMTFAPRIIAVSLTLVVTLPWTLRVMMNYTERVMATAVEQLK